MTSTPASNADADAGALRQCIDDFIRERLQTKLDKLADDENDKRDQLRNDYQREAWLGDAARRVGQIQLVTHALKFIHPDARGTNVHEVSDRAVGALLSSAGEHLPDDVVGNAAALDVFKLLTLEHNGQTLLQRIRSGDKQVIPALSDDAEQAQAWCAAFSAIVEDHGSPASDSLAKQLFFPLADGSYHLLAPLYPTALAHRLYQRIQAVRFSEEAKMARDAKRSAKPHAGYCEYPNLAARTFGGSKPQNISQLNSERRGTGYLLASCPPQWQHQGLKPPLRVETIFDRWLSSFRSLRELTRGLAQFLSGTRHNNLAIRQTRARFVAQIVDEVLHLARTIQQLPSGWSAADECRLNQAELLWLDPGRCVADKAFAAARDSSDWPDTIARKFANWLNHQIHSDRLPVDDASALQWHRDFAQEMADFQREIADDR